jgi:hypothetical protein
MKRLFARHVDTHRRRGFVRLENVLAGLPGQRLAVLPRGVKKYVKRYFVERTAFVITQVVITFIARASVVYFMVNPHCVDLFPANIHFFFIKPK